MGLRIRSTGELISFILFDLFNQVKGYGGFSRGFYGVSGNSKILRKRFLGVLVGSNPFGGFFRRSNISSPSASVRKRESEMIHYDRRGPGRYSVHMNLNSKILLLSCLGVSTSLSLAPIRMTDDPGPTCGQMRGSLMEYVYRVSVYGAGVEAALAAQSAVLGMSCSDVAAGYKWSIHATGGAYPVDYANQKAYCDWLLGEGAQAFMSNPTCVTLA